VHKKARWYARVMTQNVYTSVANSMVVHAQIVTGRMATLPLGDAKRVLLLAELSGPSTSGGVHARQSMMLAGGGEQPVCGWVDFSTTSAEVRDFVSLKKSYEQRFRKPIDVREVEYREWLQKLLMVFKELGVRCDVTGDEFASAATDPAFSRPGVELSGAEPDRSSLAPVFIAGALAIGGLLVVFLLLLRS
jgi:hypothetical protein